MGVSTPVNILKMTLFNVGLKKTCNNQNVFIKLSAEVVCDMERDEEHVVGETTYLQAHVTISWNIHVLALKYKTQF